MGRNAEIWAEVKQLVEHHVDEIQKQQQLSHERLMKIAGEYNHPPKELLELYEMLLEETKTTPQPCTL